MPGFEQKALMKFNKNELIVIIQEQGLRHEKHEEHIENLIAEVRKLTVSFAKLQSKLVISKNITSVLS